MDKDYDNKHTHAMATYQCPNCAIEMEYRLHKGTHAWFCPECPLILFEFWNMSDLDNLKVLIK